MNKVLVFTLPISWLLFLIFKDCEYSWIAMSFLGGNIGYTWAFIYKYFSLRDSLKNYYFYEENGPYLTHIDPDTMLDRLKKWGKLHE